MGCIIFAVVNYASFNIFFKPMIADTPATTAGLRALKGDSFEPSKVNTDLESRRGPFKMPINGKKFEIFQPLYDMDDSNKNKQLLAAPQEFIKTFEERISWVDTMVTKTPELKEKTTEEHATYMYLEMIKSFVSAVVFNEAENSVLPALRRTPATTKLDLSLRNKGNDWTYAGDTMIGSKRIDNILQLLTDVIRNDIKGDYIETGVWRGGASVFAKAALSALEPDSTRVSYVCDSFLGLPPGERQLDRGDKGWDNSVYLKIPSNVVANNFIKYGLLDPNVVFAKGFFNETMPPLSKHIQTLSIMRLDGDMYESTVDVLYHLYDKISVGGYVIIDDWVRCPARRACEDFFKVHEINPEIVKIDNLSAYWKKMQQVEVQFWRYEQSNFKPEDTNSATR